MAPEVAVGARYPAVLVRPRVPELALVLLETDARGGSAREEPEVLDDDVLPGDLLRRRSGKPSAGQPRSSSGEGRRRVDAGPVRFPCPVGEDFADDVEVGLHGGRVWREERRASMPRKRSLRAATSGSAQGRARWRR